jgi:hypothetical protein
MPTMRRGSRRQFLLIPVLLLAAACAGVPTVEEALEVQELQTGYDDGGVEAGQNRLLPTVSFKLRNKDARSINSVQVNAVFRVVEDPEELGSQSVWAIDYKGLPGGQTVGPFVMRSRFGYSGEQARVDMFQHEGFKDVVVQVFAKQGGNQWVKLTEQVIERQLLAIAPSPAKAAQ